MNDNERIRDEVLASVSNLSDDQLNERQEEGNWSIMQVLDHLYLMEHAIVHAISEQLANGETKTTSEKPIQFTTDRSVKVDAPAFVIPSTEFTSLKNMKIKLSKSRESLNHVINSANTTLFEQRTYPHPVFGELSINQWIPFIGLHEKRHLAQIEELKAKFV